MSAEMQAMCFFADASLISVFDTLLTKNIPGEKTDMRLSVKLGLQPMQVHEHHPEAGTPRGPAIPVPR